MRLFIVIINENCMLVERKGNIEIGGEEVIINKEIVGKEFVLR